MDAFSRVMHDNCDIIVISMKWTRNEEQACFQVPSLALFSVGLHAMEPSCPTRSKIAHISMSHSRNKQVLFIVIVIVVNIKQKNMYLKTKNYFCYWSELSHKAVCLVMQPAFLKSWFCSQTRVCRDVSDFAVGFPFEIGHFQNPLKSPRSPFWKYLL